MAKFVSCTPETEVLTFCSHKHNERRLGKQRETAAVSVFVLTFCNFRGESQNIVSLPDYEMSACQINCLSLPP